MTTSVFKSIEKSVVWKGGRAKIFNFDCLRNTLMYISLEKIYKYANIGLHANKHQPFGNATRQLLLVIVVVVVIFTYCSVESFLYAKHFLAGTTWRMSNLHSHIWVYMCVCLCKQNDFSTTQLRRDVRTSMIQRQECAYGCGCVSRI